MHVHEAVRRGSICDIKNNIAPKRSLRMKRDVQLPLEKFYNKYGFSTAKRIEMLNFRHFISFRHSQMTSGGQNTCISFTYRNARTYCPYTFEFLHTKPFNYIFTLRNTCDVSVKISKCVSTTTNKRISTGNHYRLHTVLSMVSYAPVCMF